MKTLTHHPHLGSSQFLEGRALSHFLEAEREKQKQKTQPTSSWVGEATGRVREAGRVYGRDQVVFPNVGSPPAPIPTVPCAQRQPGVEERPLSRCVT